MPSVPKAPNCQHHSHKNHSTYEKDAEACYRLVGQTLGGLQKGYDRYADAAGKALAAWLIDVVGLKDSMVDSNAKTLKGILCYIQQRFSENISIVDTALHFGYSPSRFSHLFTSLVGCSFTQYLKKVRCANADEMLKQRMYPFHRSPPRAGIPICPHFIKRINP